MSDITQIRIGTSKVGLIGLSEILEQVRTEELPSDDIISERLLDLATRRNYVADSRRDEYARALLCEYKRYCGQRVQPEEGEILEIRVLGPGCPNCERLMHEVREVLQKQGVDADLEHVRDLREIGQYGPVATPGLVINGRVVSTGRVPLRARIVEWIEEARK